MGIVGLLGKFFIGSAVVGYLVVKILETFTEMGSLSTGLIFRRDSGNDKHSDGSS